MFYLYSLTFNDGFAGVATRTYAINAATFVAARLVADNILSAAQNLTTAWVVKELLTEGDAVAGAAGATSNVDEGLTWQFDLGGGKRASINFPSPVLSVVNTDRSVDLLDPLVVALLDIYTNGDIFVSDGELVLSVIKGQLDR